MDNITHSLVGAFAAEGALLAGSPNVNKAQRRLICLSSVIANNLPDIDFLYTWITSPTKIGYLVHHRGHTHTLILIPILAAVSLWISVLFMGKNRRELNSSDYRLGYGVACVGIFLHIFFDALNVYGVHPFWPFSNQWIYFDTLFIIEPLLWLVFVPVLLVFTESRWVKRIYRMIVFLGLALMVGTGLVPTYSIVFGMILVLYFRWGIRRISSRMKWSVSFLGVVVLIFSFAMARKEATRRSLPDASPEISVLDNVLSPHPANPICWTVWSVTKENDQYSAARGTLSILPAWIPNSQCPDLRGGKATAPLVKVNNGNPRVTWHGQFQAPVQQWQSLRKDNCEFAAFTQFARVPFWFHSENSVIMGDLRFDREPALGFAELQSARVPSKCPRYLPPWIAPRSELD